MSSDVKAVKDASTDLGHAEDVYEEFVFVQHGDVVCGAAQAHGAAWWRRCL